MFDVKSLKVGFWFIWFCIIGWMNKWEGKGNWVLENRNGGVVGVEKMKKKKKKVLYKIDM